MSSRVQEAGSHLQSGGIGSIYLHTSLARAKGPHVPVAVGTVVELIEIRLPRIWLSSCRGVCGTAHWCLSFFGRSDCACSSSLRLPSAACSLHHLQLSPWQTSFAFVQRDNSVSVLTFQQLTKCTLRRHRHLYLTLLVFSFFKV